MRYTGYMAVTPKKQAASTNRKTNFEPNKMSLAVASFAAVALILLAIIVVYM